MDDPNLIVAAAAAFTLLCLWGISQLRDYNKKLAHLDEHINEMDKPCM